VCGVGVWCECVCVCGVCVLCCVWCVWVCVCECVFVVCVCVCVCVGVCAWLGTFGVSTGEKKFITNEKECREGQLIWRVSLFQGSV